MMPNSALTEPCIHSSIHLFINTVSSLICPFVPSFSIFISYLLTLICFMNNVSLKTVDMEMDFGVAIHRKLSNLKSI